MASDARRYPRTDIRRFARPLESEDFGALKPLDEVYALEHNLEPHLSKQSLSFYTRTGHSFVAIHEQRACAFALAQAVWNGLRPSLYINYLASQDEESCKALIDALVKSAYDAAIYDLKASIPQTDAIALNKLADNGFTRLANVTLARVLGSRS